MSETRHFRVSPRPQLECRVEFRLDPQLSPSNFVAYTRDLGNGGLFATTDYSVAKGNEVEIVLTTPSTWSPLVLPAKVCWTKPEDDEGPQGVGVKFTGLTDSQLYALDQFVQTLEYEI